MSEDNSETSPIDEAQSAEPEAQSAAGDAAASSGEEAEAKAEPSWEYRKNFKVVDKMTKIVNLTIDVANEEIKRYRKKIDKLTYGS